MAGEPPVSNCILYIDDNLNYLYYDSIDDTYTYLNTNNPFEYFSYNSIDDQYQIPVLDDDDIIGDLAINIGNFVKITQTIHDQLITGTYNPSNSQSGGYSCE